MYQGNILYRRSLLVNFSQNFLVTRFFSKELETDFDATSFLESAKDAFWISRLKEGLCLLLFGAGVLLIDGCSWQAIDQRTGQCIIQPHNHSSLPFAAMQLQQQRKWDVLSEMVAPKLLEKLQEDYKEHDERPDFKELDWRWVLPDEFDAGLVDLKFWSPRRAEECVACAVAVGWCTFVQGLGSI